MGGGLNENAVMKCGVNYCRCLIRYFEKFIRFLNSNAYIMIALTGQNFCSAAYDAFYLIFRNALKVAITHGRTYTKISLSWSNLLVLGNCIHYSLHYCYMLSDRYLDRLLQCQTVVPTSPNNSNIFLNN